MVHTVREGSPRLPPCRGRWTRHSHGVLFIVGVDWDRSRLLIKLLSTGRLGQGQPRSHPVGLVKSRWDGERLLALLYGLVCDYQGQSLVERRNQDMLTVGLRLLVGEWELTHLADRMNSPEEEPDTGNTTCCERTDLE